MASPSAAREARTSEGVKLKIGNDWKRARALQLHDLVRLYVKELLLKNFAGARAEQLLERMIELSLYAEEKLKAAA